ncbi:MAG: hypothetical protein CMB48_01065 [Euryarchaeota archaeon]|nr:hypothetical protein [Euryarchaeota archaeon]|tara:strand:- start:12455 stop:13030 length:576 start_codon:yes stop_codon:yes gene_type:complete
MREQEESRDLLYAIRALEIMMSSGVGLEAAILSISGGGYGIISEDFQKMIKQQKKGKKLEIALRDLMKKASSKGYKKLLTTMYNNVKSNTDVLKTLQMQAEAEEEERNEKMQKYIEDLGGLPESLLSIGMISPILLGLVGLAPQLMGDAGAIMGTLPSNSTMMNMVRIGLGITLLGMAFIGMKAHTKDPGV